jgi:peptidoglycan/LPS O-acetylase OafA/YrhL
VTTAALLAPSTKRGIPPALSLYLDLVRFFAALSVVLYHTWSKIFPDRPFKWPGHEAVVVFFVLSGYVIAFSAMRPGVTLRMYAEHRIARIVPPAYAALLLGIAVCLYKPGVLGDASLWWDSLSNALFIAQSGPFFIDAPLNTPFWSLNYEVWYYAIFGAWLFVSPAWRWPLTAVVALLAGPKILMLFPVWLFGVLLYQRMPVLKPSLAWICFLATLLAGALMTWMNLSDHLRTFFYATVPGAWRTHYSTQFLYDILLGVVVSVHFTAVASLPGLTRWLEPLAQPIRFLAGCTFSLYVFHNLLMVLVHDVFGVRDPLPFYALVALGALVAAELTERRSRWYRMLVRKLFGMVGTAETPSKAVAQKDVQLPLRD